MHGAGVSNAVPGGLRSPQNGLALALREVGRIERALFTLNWLDDPMPRQQTTAELNKGESRDALARVVCFHRVGRLRDRTLESRQHRAIRLLRGQWQDIPDKLLPYLAPLAPAVPGSSAARTRCDPSPHHLPLMWVIPPVKAGRHGAGECRAHSRLP
jgi:hypothetical protein